MPIIRSRTAATEKVKFQVSAALIEEVKEYCEWIAVKDVVIFFEQAAEFVLDKDKEWKKYRKNKAKNKL